MKTLSVLFSAGLRFVVRRYEFCSLDIVGHRFKIRSDSDLRHSVSKGQTFLDSKYTWTACSPGSPRNIRPFFDLIVEFFGTPCISTSSNSSSSLCGEKGRVKMDLYFGEVDGVFKTLEDAREPSKENTALCGDGTGGGLLITYLLALSP